MQNVDGNRIERAQNGYRKKSRARHFALSGNRLRSTRKMVLLTSVRGNIQGNNTFSEIKQLLHVFEPCAYFKSVHGIENARLMTMHK